MPRRARLDAFRSSTGTFGPALRPGPSVGMVHHVILRGMKRGQTVADGEDRESFLARLGLSLADAARLLGISTSESAKVVANAGRPSVH